MHENDTQVEAAFYRELGRKLFDKRMSRKMSRETLAREVGCHRNTVMRWEEGDCVIPIWMLLRICDVLCCNHLLILPAREYTWGREYQAMKREREGIKNAVQSERDPFITDAEINHLRKTVGC